MTERDRIRLARVFGVELTRPTGTVLVGVSVALIGGPLSLVGLVPAGVLFAGLGKMLVDDRKQIARGLAEVELWGFPVDGYREWLLADAPTFEIELRRELGAGMVEEAIAAIDKVCRVTRPARTVIRVATPTIALAPTRRYPPVRVGDRRLLHDIFQRVLAPLHADVGIVRMRMGEFMSFHVEPPRRALASGVPPEGDGGGHGAFREQAIAAPPALQALVRSGATQLAPPAEANRLRDRDQRLLYATGQRPAGMGSILAAASTALVAAGFAAGPAGAGIAGLGAMFASLGVIIARNRRRAARIGPGVELAFPLEGFHDWLLSGRPIIDVELATACDRAFVAERVRGLDWDVSWLDDQLLRIETWPRYVATYDTGIPPFWGGNPPVFIAIATRLLQPLHEHAGIVAVRMGGYLDRR
jgi:hypothetical protein